MAKQVEEKLVILESDKEINTMLNAVIKTGGRLQWQVHCLLVSGIAHHVSHNFETAGTVLSKILRGLEMVPGLDNRAIQIWARQILGGNAEKNPVRFSAEKGGKDKVIRGANKDTFNPVLKLTVTKADKTEETTEYNYHQLPYYRFAPSKMPKDWNFDDALLGMAKLIDAKIKKGDVKDIEKPRAELAANLLNAIAKGIPAATLQSMSMVSSAAIAGKQINPKTLAKVLH